MNPEVPNDVLNHFELIRNKVLTTARGIKVYGKKAPNCIITDVTFKVRETKNKFVPTFFIVLENGQQVNIGHNEVWATAWRFQFQEMRGWSLDSY